MTASEMISLRLGVLDPDRNQFLPAQAALITTSYRKGYLGVLRQVFASANSLLELAARDTHVGRDFAGRLHPTDSIDSLTVVRFECPALWGSSDATVLLHAQYDLYVVLKQVGGVNRQIETDLVVVIDKSAISLLEYLALDAPDPAYVAHITELVADMRRKARDFALGYASELESLIPDPA